MSNLASVQHNAAVWHQEFLATFKDSRNAFARLNRGKLLKSIAENTIAVCSDGAYLNQNHERVQLDISSSTGVICEDSEAPELQAGSTDGLSISVINDDCVDVAIGLIREGLRPALLNMANEAAAGGGWKTGAAAQEEDLFRRSDYHLIVQKEHYPLPEHGCAYTPRVLYFRRGRDHGYAFMDMPVAIDTIACAAYVNPPTCGLRLQGSFQEGTVRKLRSVFAAARLQGNDSIVLSAFGCGAFNNPPTAIARIMKQVCEEYRQYFKQVIIAVIDNDGKSNAEAFQMQFRSSEGSATSDSVLSVAGPIDQAVSTAELGSSFSAPEACTATSCDPTKPIKVESVEECKAAEGEPNVASGEPACQEALAQVATACDTDEFLSIEELRDPLICTGKGIPPDKREQHLSDADFKAVSDMSKEDFAKLPKWKQKAQKKDVGLF